MSTKASKSWGMFSTVGMIERFGCEEGHRPERLRSHESGVVAEQYGCLADS